MFGNSMIKNNPTPKADKDAYYSAIQDKEDILKISITDDCCYICGRKEEDCKKIKDKILDEIDNRINADNKKIEELLSSNKDIMSKMITGVKDNDYLDFSVKTIKSDFNKFREFIPNLESLLKFSLNDSETINDIKQRVEGYFDENKNLILEGKNEVKPIKELKKSISLIKEEINDLMEKREAIDKHTDYSLLTYSLYYTKDGHRVFTPPNGPTYYYFDGQYFRKENDHGNVNRAVKPPMDIKIDVKICKTCADLILYPSYMAFNSTQRGY